MVKVECKDFDFFLTDRLVASKETTYPCINLCISYTAFDS